ncbi:MAG: hypothetical protein IRZ33_02995 [Alicyclobacillaceae bacterium]|nr:hypothetical protein [Alicyclobacillaceae bacterium]
MPYHAFVAEHSRKAKAVRGFYEHLRNKLKPEQWETTQWEAFRGFDGIRVPQGDKHRVLNIRLQDEHLSPYFKTDMNLFHMLMLDVSADMTIFRSDRGWLFEFDGVPSGPKPFGQMGYDPR